MKRILLILAILLAAWQLSAVPVDLAAAKAKAMQCVTSQVRAGGQAPSTLKPTLALVQKGVKNPNQAVYYIFNTEQNFIIVAGDDRAEEILAVGDRPLDVNRLPENMMALLRTYSEQIDYLLSNPDIQVAKPFNASAILGATTVEPMLTALWDQLEPYWNQCVFSDYQCLTGCPATSASMVYYYWKYPIEPTPDVPKYQFELNYSAWESMMVDVPALPSVTFDWENMLDVYTDGYTTEQANAVATLMRYVGQAERMKYGTSEMGGSGVATDSVNNIAQAFILFGYDENTVRTVKKMKSQISAEVQYTDAEWAEMIVDELIEGRPIVYTANSFGGGHAFNVDGYDASTNLYHVNFGWSGNGNGNFELNAFSDGHSTYNDYPQMIIGIQPTYDGPAVLTSTSKIVMEGFTGETASQTFTVKGRDLTADVTLAVEDENSAFATDVTTVSINDVQGEGKEITVTFTPQAIGEYNAILTLTSANARKTVVRLIGTAALRKENPVAIGSSDVQATSFRAVWTDETPTTNVASYTLVVQQAGIEMAEEVATADFSSLNYTGMQGDAFDDFDSYCTPCGWTGSDVYPDKGGVRLGVASNQPVGTLTTPTLDFSRSGGKLTITFRCRGYGGGTGNALLNITTGNHTVTQPIANSVKTYTVILDCDEFSDETVSFTSENKRVFLTHVTITTTDGSSSGLKSPVEQGDATSRIITGITDKFYDVTNLQPGGTYHYKVQAYFIDGTQSLWSNSQKVVLPSEGTIVGDINGDGQVDIADVNAVINIMLGKVEQTPTADINGDGNVDIADVNAVINIMLGK